MNVCGVLLWPGSRTRVYSFLAPDCSRDRFRVHHSPDQGKVVTKEWMNKWNLNWIIDKDTDVAAMLKADCSVEVPAGRDKWAGELSTLW